MKVLAGRWSWDRAGVQIIGVILFGAVSLPTFAQEGSSDVTNMPVGTVFRWLNFLLVFGVLSYLIVKYGAPYFRARAESVAKSIAEAAQTRSAAEHELQQWSQKLSSIDSEIEEERRTAQRESTADRERIRMLAKSEVEKIGQAARAEIAAAERAGTQELRAIAARLATDRAGALIREQMNAAAQAALFDSFVDELERAVS